MAARHPRHRNPHLPSNVRQWWGNSRGRWEGKTLVVDVTNFSPKTYFQGSYENLHLVERWTRLDANTIEYAVTIDDPTTWTRPWTVKQEYNKQNDFANRHYKEPRCHEGNYGMVGAARRGRVPKSAPSRRGEARTQPRCAPPAAADSPRDLAMTGEDSNPLTR